MAEEKRIEIYKGLDGEVVFDVDTEEETIWATRTQIAQVFGVTPQNITMHMKHVFESGELREDRTSKESLLVQNEGGRNIQRKVKLYNLDAIISVGYRVNSKKATQFRIWATSVLKHYLDDGVAINEKRLKTLAEREELEKLHNVEKMIGLVRRLTTLRELSAGEAKGVIEIISRYMTSFKVLQEYDEGYIDLRFLNTKQEQHDFTVEICEKAVAQLKKSIDGGELFGKKRGGQDLSTFIQSLNGDEKYKNIPEKAANLLYFIVKGRPFCDGNKRIGAFLFVLFLTLNNCHLTKDGETKISDRALTAITLLIAESEQKEKKLIIELICKLLEN